MYAIVDIASKQFKVEEGDKLYVPHLGKYYDEGDTATFEDVLLLREDGEVAVGQPLVEGASVEASVLQHVKDDKVIVFKIKRRKRYRRRKGHRQLYTQIQIDAINGSEGGSSSSEESEEEVSEKSETAETEAA